MWKNDPVTRVAFAALLCSILTQWLSSRQSELCSETLAWILLPVVFGAAKQQPDIDQLLGMETRPASTYSLWIVALSIVTLCVFQAESGLVGFFPALTPSLLVVERYLGSEFRASGRPDSFLFSPLVNTLWGSTLVAFVAIFALSDWDFWAHALSIIPVLVMLLGYATLSPGPGLGAKSFAPFDIGREILPLSKRIIIVMITVLGVETSIFGFPRSDIAQTLMLGLTKAFAWYSISQITQNSSWRTATAIGAFSIVSTRSPFASSSDFVASLHVIASFLALGQVIYILPRQAKAKPALWIFFLISLVPYLTNIFVIKNSQSSLLHSQTHPVEFIIRNAKTDFAESVKKQSQTYTAAHGEYQRRYGLEPPPGFQAWYEFAKAHQSPIIDEFDTIYNAVSPFWKLSGREVLDTITDMHDAPYSELWLCEFSSQRAQTGCSYRHRKFDRNIQLLFNRLLKDLPGVLPDMKFLVNHLDEPRVIIPPASLENNEPSLTDISGKPVWKALTKFCFPQSKRRNTRTKHITETFGLPFITDTSSAMDLCQHPEYNATHGLSMSPTSFRPIEGAVPILSTGTLSTMGDILYPSPAYNESEFQYSDAHDVDWDKKWNNLYWAGSTTGGFAADDQWHHYHRQRFVELAQNLQKRDHTYLQEKDGVISRVKSSFLNSRLFDVAFTRIFQCNKKPCHDQRAYFRTKSWTDKDQPLRSRLVFDLDGNGISGRYYKLLASKSVPLKQTLLREWHDDRLVPWVHYVPVSQSMDELPELVTYLTSTVSGQKRAEEIAEQGREWFSRAFRDVDLTIYTYRLMLELARLQDPNRPAGGLVS